ncbi:MAG: hypothetical protein WC956_09000 [bacterium]
MKNVIYLAIALASITFAALAIVPGTAAAQDTGIYPLTFAVSATAAKKMISDANGTEEWSPPGLISSFEDGDDRLFCVMAIDPGADLCDTVSSEENAQRPYVVVISNAAGSSLCDELRMLSGIGGQRCASFYGKSGTIEDSSMPAVSGVTKYQIELIDAGIFSRPMLKDAPFAQGLELKAR